MSSSLRKVVTELPNANPNLISSRHTEGENSTESDTKTSKHREPNQEPHCNGQ